MSGTSLDGLDLCLAEFQKNKEHWKFNIIAAKTTPYLSIQKEMLINAESCSGSDLVQCHFEYGRFLGEAASEFLSGINETANLIASHGHTLFHQINKRFTFQLGHGAAIAAESKITTISDFRSLDVALNGQGAPLVPFGDQELFSEYSCCINLGGIINLSFSKNGVMQAFDVCPINMVINHYMRKVLNKEYDSEGELSRTGSLNQSLLSELNDLEFYKASGPKSLGKEWVYSKIIPTLDLSNIPLIDKLFTFTTHAALQLATILKRENLTSNIIITGGGVKNTFFLECLRNHGVKFDIPSDQIIDFKEALIFGFLGLKSYLGEVNTLKSVTGASRDSIGGTCYFS